jgi:hypothetical protein
MIIDSKRSLLKIAGWGALAAADNIAGSDKYEHPDTAE